MKGTMLAVVLVGTLYVSMLLNSDTMLGAGSAYTDSAGATYPGRWYDVSGSGSTNCSPQSCRSVS